MIEKFKTLNNKVAESTKNITFKNFIKAAFPFLLYALTFTLISFFVSYVIFPKPFDDFWGVDVINKYNVYINLHRVPYTGIIAVSALLFMFRNKVSAILYFLISVILLLYSFAQVCYYNVAGSLFRLRALLLAKEGLQFADEAIIGVSKLSKSIFISILVFIIVSAFIIIKFYKEPVEEKPHKVKKFCCTSLFIFCVLLNIFISPTKKAYGISMFDFYMNEEYKNNTSVYNYNHLFDGEKLYKDTDIFVYLQRDFVCMVKQYIFKGNNKIIDEYFENKALHNNNSKTGIFEGKNLMVIQMEGMEYSTIDEKYCPNITSLMEKSIVFENFYSSMFANAHTFGTETAVNTGMFAPSGSNLSSDFKKNVYPYSLANLFKSAGYSANEYHYNTPNFYNRGIMSAVYGYTDYIQYKYYAENKNQNFELDDVLATDDGIYNKLIENEKFLDYVVTYTPHMPFSINDTTYIEAVTRHPSVTATDPDDELQVLQAKASITDDMVGVLLERLENDGVLDNTVLLFITDHYAFSIHKNIDQNLYSNTPFFIYAKGVEPETVTKVCNTSDVLPTILNMFGIGDCNKYLGYDIFDDSYEGYAYFENLSWITGDFYYKDGEIAQNYTGKIPQQEFIDKINEEVKNRNVINTLIMFTNYYSEDKFKNEITTKIMGN